MQFQVERINVNGQDPLSTVLSMPFALNQSRAATLPLQRFDRRRRASHTQQRCSSSLDPGAHTLLDQFWEVRVLPDQAAL